MNYTQRAARAQRRADCISVALGLFFGLAAVTCFVLAYLAA